MEISIKDWIRLGGNRFGDEKYYDDKSLHIKSKNINECDHLTNEKCVDILEWLARNDIEVTTYEHWGNKKNKHSVMGGFDAHIADENLQALFLLTFKEPWGK